MIVITLLEKRSGGKLAVRLNACDGCGAQCFRNCLRQGKRLICSACVAVRATTRGNDRKP